MFFFDVAMRHRMREVCFRFFLLIIAVNAGPRQNLLTPGYPDYLSDQWSCAGSSCNSGGRECDCSPFCFVYHTCCRDVIVHCLDSFRYAKTWFPPALLLSPPASCPVTIKPGRLTISECPDDQRVDEMSPGSVGNRSVDQMVVGISQKPLPVLDLWTGVVYLNDRIFHCYRSAQSSPIYFVEVFTVNFGESDHPASTLSGLLGANSIFSFRSPIKDGRLKYCGFGDGRFPFGFQVTFDFNSLKVDLEDNQGGLENLHKPYREISCDAISGKCKDKHCPLNTKEINGECKKETFLTLLSSPQLAANILNFLTAVIECVSAESDVLPDIKIRKILPYIDDSPLNRIYFAQTVNATDIDSFRNATYSQIELTLCYPVHDSIGYARELSSSLIFHIFHSFFLGALQLPEHSIGNLTLDDFFSVCLYNFWTTCYITSSSLPDISEKTRQMTNTCVQRIGQNEVANEASFTNRMLCGFWYVYLATLIMYKEANSF